MTTKINQDSSKSVELKSDACYYKMSRLLVLRERAVVLRRAVVQSGRGRRAAGAVSAWGVADQCLEGARWIQ